MTVRPSGPRARNPDPGPQPRENMRSAAAACCYGPVRRQACRAVRQSGSWLLRILGRRHRVAFVLLAIPDQIKRTRGEASGLAPMHQRVLLAMGNPDFA